MSKGVSFGPSATKLSDFMPVRVLTVDADEESSSNSYDLQVQRACIESKEREEAELREKFPGPGKHKD